MDSLFCSISSLVILIYRNKITNLFKKKIKSWPFILDMDQICLKFILRKLDMYIQKKVL